MIERPIDLALIKNKCRRGDFESKEMYMDDIRLLAANALQYNGPEHFVTKKANELLSLAE